MYAQGQKVAQEYILKLLPEDLIVKINQILEKDVNKDPESG